MTYVEWAAKRRRTWSSIGWWSRTRPPALGGRCGVGAAGRRRGARSRDRGGLAHEGNGFEGWRKVIDLSGEGSGWTEGRAPPAHRGRGGVVINGLAILCRRPAPSSGGRRRPTDEQAGAGRRLSFAAAAWLEEDPMLRAALVALAIAGSARAQGREAVDLELVLLADATSSIDRRAGDAAAGLCRGAGRPGGARGDRARRRARADRRRLRRMGEPAAAGRGGRLDGDRRRRPGAGLRRPAAGGAAAGRRRQRDRRGALARGSS